ncbi:MAG: hypothetical protein KJO18_02825 [Acidimicrobiia bacterium]|nr:hypothetical protein [Acidimicrobiia bacterium]
MITIQMTDSIVVLGQRLAGYVTWQVDGRQPEAVEVSAQWRTEGRGNVDSGTVHEVRTELSDSEFSSQWLTVDAPIPLTAPITYDGKLIRIIWELHVRLDIPWGRDEKHEERFVVVPVGSDRRV